MLTRSLWFGLAAAAAAVVAGSSPARAGNEHHPYGVIPYGFAYPTDEHIWKALDIVYCVDMKHMKNWGPHGPGYYSCNPNGCGPYGGTPCCGLTPLHYNAPGISPANVAKPYPARPGASYYDAVPVAYQPVPGWDIPEFPPNVKGPGYSTMYGFVPYTKHTRGRAWYAGKELEQNFYIANRPYPSQRP